MAGAIGPAEGGPMCPVCIGTVALVAAGTTSTGGLTALLVRKLFNKNAKKSMPTHKVKGVEHGSTENRIAG
jgi:hypothetical protein